MDSQMRNLRSKSKKRPAQKKVFLISCTAEGLDRINLARSISKLGGKCQFSQTFEASCTHVICGRLERNETLLGACATGRWVLHHSYVTDSDEAGTWLEERHYEWCHAHISRRYPCDQVLASATKRWRISLRSNNCAFKDWIVAVVAEKETSDIERLLKSGGAKIYHLELPLTNPGSTVKTLRYIFVTDHFYSDISSLRQYGVLCIKPKFIEDYLLKDPPPDPKDYLVKGPAETTYSHLLQVSKASPSAPAHVSLSASPAESRPSTSTLQHSLDQISSSSDDEAGLSLQKVIERDIEYQRKKNNPGKKKSLELDDNESDGVEVMKTLAQPTSTPAKAKVLATRENVSAMAARIGSLLKRKQIPDNSLKQLTQETGNGDKQKFDKQLIDRGKQLAAKEGNQAKAAILSSSLEKNNAHRTDISETTENRDNIDEQIADKQLDDAAKGITISRCQKRKAELSPALKETKRQKCVTESTGMQDTLLEDTHITIENLQILRGNISPIYRPEPQTLIQVKDVLLNASNATVAEIAYNVLDEAIRLHPPVDLPAQNMYIKVLSGGEKDMSRAIVIAWYLIKKRLSDILVEREPQMIMNNRMFLRFLKSLFHLSLEHAFLQTSSKQPSRHMLQRLLWYPSNTVSINEQCQQLMDHFATIITQFHHKTTHLDCQTQFELTEIISWMVAMVAECIRLSESPNSSVTQGLRGNTFQWVKTLTSHLKDITSWSDLQHVLRSFQLPWLSLAVCEQLLDDLKDTLCPDIAVRKSLTLSRIVQYHMFLLPKFLLNLTPLETSSPDIHNKRPKSNQGTSDTNPTVSQTDISKKLKKVNKRNPKGETALHTACIKNDLAELKRLLKIPGIDVNIKDNFGWTPLHEACHHGNLDCVKDLLNYELATNLDEFSKDNNPPCCKKVDLLATNEEGITPLHKAVLSEQYQVCKVLLQHGGPALLKPVTCYGYTPLQLAVDTEMYSLLCSFLTQKNHTVSESQDSVSRSQGFLNCYEGVFNVPSDAMYDEVTHCEGKRIYAETQSLLMFIHLVTALVEFYIQCKDLTNIHLQASVGENLGRDSEDEEASLLQKDLHVLSHFRDHIGRFRAHLNRIRHEEDAQAVKEALKKLSSLAEVLYKNKM